MGTANASAVEAARAVNALLGLSSNDQGALLEVLEDYFASPDFDCEVEELNDSSDTEDDDSFDALLEGTLPSNTSTIIKNLTSLLKIIHNTANKTNN